MNDIDGIGQYYKQLIAESKAKRPRINAERLLNAARALRESPNPEHFSMVRYGWNCDTPACVLGHYAFRGDLQSEFHLKSSRWTRHNAAGVTVRSGASLEQAIQAHFGITAEESDELFGLDGCFGARTVLAAAEYIERWVAQRAKPE